jgi:predicted RNase H-like HicB family nuclease
MKYNYTMTTKQGYTGVYIGQCDQIKGIIVQGKDLPDVKSKMEKCIEGYLAAFPEERSKLC